VNLGSAAAPLLRSPRSLAQWGNILYFIDDETQQIVILGANELKGMSGDYTPVNPVFDFSQTWSSGTRAQAVLALGGKLFVLCRVLNPNTGGELDGVLFRLNIASGGALAPDAQALMSANPQAIIPIRDDSAVQLMIPAIGGDVLRDGTTNGTNSDIRTISALGTWTPIVPENITGDPAASPPTAYDIVAAAAADRGFESMVYILTRLFTGGTPAVKWRLYRGTARHILWSSYKTLSAAVTSKDLEVVDEGTANNAGPCLWKLFYEQLRGPGDTGDRLWAALGNSLLATRAAAGTYGSPTSAEDSPAQSPFVCYGCDINCMDLTIGNKEQGTDSK
jgi:hypothetical protein